MPPQRQSYLNSQTARCRCIRDSILDKLSFRTKTLPSLPSLDSPVKSESSLPSKESPLRKKKGEEENRSIPHLVKSQIRLKLSLIPVNCNFHPRQQLFLMIIQSNNELYKTTRGFITMGQMMKAISSRIALEQCWSTFILVLFNTKDVYHESEKTIWLFNWRQSHIANHTMNTFIIQIWWGLVCQGLKAEVDAWSCRGS